MKLFYRQFGQGRPVIILHGLFGLSDNWVSIGKRIATQFAVYIPDLRNHGQSAHSPAMNYQAMADDLLEFIEDQKLENVILIGHSMGGKVAMNFALDHPNLLNQLVVIDISPRRYPARSVHSDIINAMLSVNLQQVTSRSQVEALLQNALPDIRIRQFILKNLYYRAPHKPAWRPNLEAIHNNLELIFDEIQRGRTFTKPSLFIRGGLSDYITPADESVIREMFPLAQIKTIPSATHWVHADAPMELCRLLSASLGKECTYDQ
jgi:pimeloyl-ACP methyl ester carboxylesterase